jgi:hypothetical protein
MEQVTIEAKEKVVKPLSLKEISQLGYIQKTREVYAGVTIAVQTLSISRQQLILSNIPTDITDPVLKYTRLQVETLAHATLSINDEKYTENDVVRLREFYGGLQSRVLQACYGVYQDAVDEQEKILTDLKKN